VRYYPATGWTADTVLSSMGLSTNVIPHASIALDANGTDIHVVWTGYNHVKQSYDHVYCQKCVPSSSGNGGWVGTPIDLCTDHTTYAHCEPAVACAPGRVVVTWSVTDEHGYAVGFREFASGTWQNQVQLDGFTTYYLGLASISAASNGDVAVAYYGTQAGQPSYHVYVLRRVGGTWQPREDATTGLPGVHFILPDIDVDPMTGYPHIVCHSYDTVTVPGKRYYHIYHTYRTTSGWQPLELITDPTVRVDCQPSMFFGCDGSAYVVWNRETDGPGIMCMVRSPSGTWGAPSFITNYPGSPGYYDMCSNVTVSSTGNVYAVWMDGRNGPYQIWGRLCTPGSFASSGLDAGTTVTPRGFALDVSPNPFSRGAVVRYSLPAEGNVSIKLYNVSGVLAKTVACGCVLPGSHAVSLDRQGFARGAYILKLESGSGSLARKFVIE